MVVEAPTLWIKASFKFYRCGIDVVSASASRGRFSVARSFFVVCASFVWNIGSAISEWKRGNVGDNREDEQSEKHGVSLAIAVQSRAYCRRQ